MTTVYKVVRVVDDQRLSSNEDLPKVYHVSYVEGKRTVGSNGSDLMAFTDLSAAIPWAGLPNIETGYEVWEAEAELTEGPEMVMISNPLSIRMLDAFWKMAPDLRRKNNPLGICCPLLLDTVWCKNITLMWKVSL